MDYILAGCYLGYIYFCIYLFRIVFLFIYWGEGRGATGVGLARRLGVKKVSSACPVSARSLGLLLFLPAASGAAALEGLEQPS